MKRYAEYISKTDSPCCISASGEAEFSDSGKGNVNSFSRYWELRCFPFFFVNTMKYK